MRILDQTGGLVIKLSNVSGEPHLSTLMDKTFTDDELEVLNQTEHFGYQLKNATERFDALKMDGKVDVETTYEKWVVELKGYLTELANNH